MNQMNVIEKYKQLVEKCSEFEIKGKNNLYTSHNGHMFSQINKDMELGIRFSEKVKKEYISKYNTKEFRSYDAVMRGYITVNDEMWRNESELLKLMKESYKYVDSLEVKS